MFRKELYNAVTEEVNMVTLSASDDKIQFIDSIETDRYGTGKDLV